MTLKLWMYIRNFVVWRQPTGVYRSACDRLLFFFCAKCVLSVPRRMYNVPQLVEELDEFNSFCQRLLDGDDQDDDQDGDGAVTCTTVSTACATVATADGDRISSTSSSDHRSVKFLRSVIDYDVDDIISLISDDDLDDSDMPKRVVHCCFTKIPHSISRKGRLHALSIRC
ncbi:MAG: hypothetical protein GY740_11315 [Gammaproteobacteria bacterium]|nr:hypothetical protein [Gammaproteobacteria bacterium]